MSARGRVALVLLAAGFLIAALAASAGRWLVVDAPKPADAIVVLAGDKNDARWHLGLSLLEKGAAPVVFVDARADEVQFGETMAALEAGYVRRSAGALASRAHVCAIRADSTNEETASVAGCLAPLRARGVLLVTSDFHTRRALLTFRKRLPQYQWSVAAARDPAIFGARWWSRRPWAKTFLLEVSKLAWWEAVDRWRRPAANPL